LKVLFSEQSRNDLVEIALDIARDKPRRAKTYIAELRAACRALKDNAHRFRVVINQPAPLRRFIHGPHLIFYSLRSDHVRIVRIIHGARLIEPEMFI